MSMVTLNFVGSREIADGLTAIEQLAAEKSELSDSLGSCREAYDKTCQEKNELSCQLDASRSELATITSQLDVCSISDLLIVHVCCYVCFHCIPLVL